MTYQTTMADRLDLLVSDFLIFRAHCEMLEITLNMFEDLYMGDAQQRMLMKRMAPYFFGDLNRILHNQFIVQVYKLTDPAATKRGQINLTFERIYQDLEECELLNTADVRQETSECIRVFKEFRNTVAKDARNRVCAHLDRDTLRELDKLDPEAAGIGAHDDEDRIRFVNHMYRFVEIGDQLLNLNLAPIQGAGRHPGASAKEIFQWIEGRTNRRKPTPGNR